MPECDCVNGTAENGWHEERGPKCRDRELESWRQMFVPLAARTQDEGETK